MSREYTMYLVDAFTSTPYYGNPAGVVLVDYQLAEEEMQKIAKEINVSETAFVESLDREEFRVRFFTPVEEVDLCGHATIATFHTLAKKGYIHSIPMGEKSVFQHTKAGRLEVKLYYNFGRIQKVIMEQAEGEDFGPVQNIPLLLEAIGLEKEDLGLEGLPLIPRKCSTGLKDMFVPVKNQEILSKITLNVEKSIELSKVEDAFSIHAFTEKEGFFYQRNFCPILGINEEAATGTSTGALLFYLQKEGIFMDSTLQAKQGLEMGRPSDIFAKYENNKIYVGGEAAIVLEGIIHV
ncbi:MAG: PhzF family phenazine biosynthesis protein [Tissierellia bacterium]|nr:PhzF family phenazine biosynthesis protein [Tissierellia bacterium]